MQYAVIIKNMLKKERHKYIIDCMKRILGSMRRCAERFNMIEDGDRIAVGVSGGKDSMVLLHAMYLYKMYMKIDYELIGITVDLGFGNFDTDRLRDYIEGLGIRYVVERTEIADVVFNIRKEKNPCALCAKMRKGAFYEAAKREGMNKAAFAHHRDDLFETLLLGLFYEGKMNVFSPVTYMSRRDITLIRPFIMAKEIDIAAAARKLGLPIVKNPCPVDGVTKRTQMREVLDYVEKINPQAKKSLMAAISNVESYNLWDKGPWIDGYGARQE